MISFNWSEVVFQHYRITDEDAFAERLPRGAELDRWRGHAYASVVSVAVDQVRAFRVPVFPRAFVQVNVRTYVRGGALVFLGNTVSSRIAAYGGWLAGTPQHHGDVAHRGFGYRAGAHHIDGELGEAIEHEPGSLASFLVDRFVQLGSVGPLTLQTRVDHERWPLHRLLVTDRSDGALAAAGLASAAVPVDEVHVSPGVHATMTAPMPVLSRRLRPHLSPT